ncbi:hypothetical protein NUH16_003830 [Penicillium rubens]|nr:hypothetical protein NUH16_003830 [Penicillium rubens]
MPRKSQNPTPWREKRRHQAEGITNARRLSKTNRERFRRQKKAAFRGANRLFVDGLDTGRDRRIYVLIMEKMKSGPRYTTRSGQKLAPNRYVGSLRLWRFTESK